MHLAARGKRALRGCGSQGARRASPQWRVDPLGGGGVEDGCRVRRAFWVKIGSLDTTAAVRCASRRSSASSTSGSSASLYSVSTCARRVD